MTVHATNPRTYSGLECPSAHLMALRSTLIWSTTPLSNIFSSFCTKSKLRSSITPDTYVVPAHNEKGLSLLTLLYEFYFLPEINCSASGCTKNWTKAFLSTEHVRESASAFYRSLPVGSEPRSCRIMLHAASASPELD